MVKFSIYLNRHVFVILWRNKKADFLDISVNIQLSVGDIYLLQVSVMKRIAELEDHSRIISHLVEIGQEIMNKNNLK